MQSEHPIEQKKRITLTDVLRAKFKGILDPIAEFLNRLGIAPNTMTLVGLMGNVIGAIFLVQGKFLVGGLVILCMGPIDALDGTMARLRGEASDFGAFVDSVTDRYSELLVFAGLMIYYLLQDSTLMAGMTFAAAGGSVLVSYVRARAEGLGFQAKVGILTRVERFVVLIPSIIFGAPMIGIWIIAIFANFTALQRILAVRKQARS